MKLKHLVLFGTLLVAAMFWIIGCSETTPLQPVAKMQTQVGLAADQIQWIGWKPEMKSKLDVTADPQEALGKSIFWGFDWKIIPRVKGGVVGGEITFGNLVEVPAFAFPEPIRLIAVWVYDNGAAGVEFFPDQTFTLDVKVTLSYANLDYEGDPQDLHLYWLDETTGLWVIVPNTEIDEINQTISGWVNHFTRYQWGF